MTDLVERLREDANDHKDVALGMDMRKEDTANWRHAQNCLEAADTIERLRAELDAIKAQQAEPVKCACGDQYPADSHGAGFIDAAGHCPNCDAAAPPSPAVPEGWTLVPKEPTPEMVVEGCRSMHCPVSGTDEPYYTYKAMLAAAPKEPT